MSVNEGAPASVDTGAIPIGHSVEQPSSLLTPPVMSATNPRQKQTTSSQSGMPSNVDGRGHAFTPTPTFDRNVSRITAGAPRSNNLDGVRAKSPRRSARG